jgi:predicted 2-oxoglutarate/Fe(II)-dependent dioxygenase YbiX
MVKRSNELNTYYRFINDNKLLSKKEIKMVKCFIKKRKSLTDPTRKTFIIKKSNELKCLFKKINKNVKQINKQSWGFKIKNLDRLEYIRYNKSSNNNSNWHMDVGVTGLNDYSKNKITCVIQLSDPKKYEGGQFQIFKNGIKNMPKGQGYAIVFPSYFMHRVKPVLKGSRDVLVAMFSGKKGFR